MAINKNFVVKNGLEVNNKLILANADTNRVGIGTSVPHYDLHVFGGIGVTHSYVSGVSTVRDQFRVGSGGTIFTVIATEGFNQFVGVGTANPGYLLEVHSPVSTGQTALYVYGDMRVTGDINLDDITLDDASIQNLTVTENLNVLVGGISTLGGPVNLTQTLDVTGITTLGSYVDINDSVDISDNLNVVGLTTLGNVVDINSTLDISDTLNVGSATTLGGYVDINADTDISGTLNVGSATTLGGYVDINNSVDISNDLNVSGVTTLSNTVNFNSTVDISGTFNVGSATTLGGYVDINNSVDISDNLNVVGLTTLGNVVDINSNTDISGSLNVGGATTLGGYVDINNSVDISNNLNVSGIGTINTLLVGTQANKSTISYTTNTARTLTIPSLGGNRTFAFINEPQTFTENQNFSNINVTGVSTLGNLKISSGIVTASSGVVTYFGDGSGLFNTPAGSPAGSNGQVQYNLSDNFAGSANLTHDGTTTRILVGIVTTISGTNLNYSGVGTITTFNSTSGTVTTGTVTNLSGTNLNYSGISSVGSAITMYGSSGIVSATSFYGKFFGDGTQLVGAGSTVFNDTTTNQDFFPLFTSVTSGTITASGISTTKLKYNPSSGEMTAVDFNSTSDYNLKKNIQTVENALEIIDNLRGVSFEWKESGKKSYGVIAQELEQVLPELVKGNDPKTVSYSGIIGVLIEAVKELSEEVKNLKNK